MATAQWVIRLVRPDDYVVLARVLREALIEMKVSFYGPDGYCELQKIYFLPNARGKGLGSQLMRKCLQQVKRSRFIYCYLDTMPSVMHTQKLYQKSGFKYIEHPLGNTNHYSCPVWMFKTLRDDT